MHGVGREQAIESESLDSLCFRGHLGEAHRWKEVVGLHSGAMVPEPVHLPFPSRFWMKTA